jgi:hypothetical protein
MRMRIRYPAIFLTRDTGFKRFGSGIRDKHTIGTYPQHCYFQNSTKPLGYLSKTDKVVGMPDKISPGPGLEPCHETLQVPGLAPLHLLYCRRHLPQVQSRGPPQVHRLQAVGAQGRGPGQPSAFYLYVDCAAVLYQKQVNRQLYCWESGYMLPRGLRKNKFVKWYLCF